MRNCFPNCPNKRGRKCFLEEMKMTFANNAPGMCRAGLYNYQIEVLKMIVDKQKGGHV